MLRIFFMKQSGGLTIKIPLLFTMIKASLMCSIHGLDIYKQDKGEQEILCTVGSARIPCYIAFFIYLHCNGKGQ